jgi:hypothetical protein
MGTADSAVRFLSVVRRNFSIGKDEMSGHGFRAVARTILDEVLGVRPDHIEHQLAHAVRDPDGRAIIHGGLPRSSPTPEQIAEARAMVDAINMAGQGTGRVHVVGGGLLCGGHASPPGL